MNRIFLITRIGFLVAVDQALEAAFRAKVQNKADFQVSRS
jgi:hypothetical protein